LTTARHSQASTLPAPAPLVLAGERGRDGVLNRVDRSFAIVEDRVRDAAEFVEARV
jgi:hypothetical protein